MEVTSKSGQLILHCEGSKRLIVEQAKYIAITLSFQTIEMVMHYAYISEIVPIQVK